MYKMDLCRVFQMRCTNPVAPIILKPNFPVQNVNDQPLEKNKLKSVQNASMYEMTPFQRLHQAPHFVLETSRGIYFDHFCATKLACL